LDTGSCDFYKSTAATKKHNDHREELDKGVPGQIRALLSPTKLAMKPKRLRGFLRKKTIDGVPIHIDDTLKKALIAYVKTAKRRAARELSGDAK